ncbi:MAG: hypothetical protein OEX18_00050 [Candidatus Krumholzibacteria bacterium]|nr:hypothetical protein [Candidatus Krumholzibacteria bacterium]MDH4335652.1 hypothetical protein [Candidatus Krumholzibacteria bacterium]MDH5270453.1 hypothetical protein [Candidatus Krumholzibacteria bacterium]MDH5628142.1 hypothetical protein [Candidatus Krumholzibacteria bacterium]
MQKALLTIAVVCGVSIAYIDSRPGWDDTGISVGMLVLTTGLLSVLGYRRSWLLALAVGAWIPLYGILTTHNPASIVAIAFALVGAYGGRLLRSAIKSAQSKN